MQRKLETAIRNQKDLAIIAKAAGDDELRRKAQQKINLLLYYLQEAEVAGAKEFCRSYGLKFILEN